MAEELSANVKKTLKDFEAKSAKTYDELVEIYKEVRAGVPDTVKNPDNRALFLVKQRIRGRAVGPTINVEGIVLDASPIFDIAGPRRFRTINTVSRYMQESNDAAIDKLIADGEVIIETREVHNERIDLELTKEKPDTLFVNQMRRQAEDGSVISEGTEYVIVPLETRKFFDQEGKRPNPNYGKPVNYADRRRIFMIGRTVSKDEVGLPKLLVIEARLDQCYNWNIPGWSLVEGFKLRVREEKDEQILLSTTRDTDWKQVTLEDKTEFLQEIKIDDLDSDEARVQLLLSAPEEFQMTIDDIWEMYDLAYTDPKDKPATEKKKIRDAKKKWDDLMSNWDRFHIIIADLLNKSNIGLGFRSNFLGEGTQPDSLDLESKSMNFWVDNKHEDYWNSFGAASRVVFGGNLADRPIWDSEEGRMSDTTAPQMDVIVFAPIPEYREEPE